MIIVVLIIAFILRLILINQSLWLDEAAQAIESIRPLTSQLDISADFQPPLFHILLHFWMRIGGTNDIWLRLLPVSISVVCVYLLYSITKYLYSKNTAILVALLYAINPYAVYYSQELRPYPLSVLTALVAVLGVVKKSRILTILGLSLFLYTTYFAPFFILALCIYYLLYEKKRLFWFFKNIAVSIGIFLPWVPYFLVQLKNGTGLIGVLPGWSEAVSTPLAKALPLTFIKFFIGRITFDNKVLYGGIFILLLSIFTYICIKLYKIGKHGFPLLLYFIPIISSWLFSFFIPVIDPKRLLFVVPFFCLILGLGIILTKGKEKIFVGFIIFITFIYGLFAYYTNARFQREQWRDAVAFVENSENGNQVVIFAFPDSFAPYQWYSQNSVLSLAVAPEFIVRDSDIDMMIVNLENRDIVYVFGYLTELTDPQGKIQRGLELNGYTHTNTYNFEGVGFIYQYDKTPLALAP